VVRRWAITIATVILTGIVGWGLVIGEPDDYDRVQSLGSRIRCPVCQGESIADSPTPYAEDLMGFVEEKVAEGWTDQQIFDYLEERFEATRLDPGFSGVNLVLWLTPALLGIYGVYLATRRLIRPTGKGDG